MNNAIWLALFLTAYKITSLATGLAFGYMGYRLFLASLTAPSGDLEATRGSITIKLRNAAPGTFFSLFGALVICFAILKGVEFNPPHDEVAPPRVVLPDQPPGE